MLIFEDLVFEKKFGGVGVAHTFDNGITISVQAGSGNYSTPREDLTSSDQFSSFEVGIWDNDVWKPVFDDTLSISNYLLEVYTRNGQLVFETRDSLQYWDGTYWGSDVDGSTYVYRLVMKTDTEDIRREGFLEVLR